MNETTTQPETTDIEPPAPDKYSRAVEYLTAHPEEIPQAWSRQDVHPYGCLFSFAAPDDNAVDITGTVSSQGQTCGCLTMIRY